MVCEHETKELVRRVYSNGATHYGRCCMRCGSFESVKKASIHSPDALPFYDESIQENWYAERKANSDARINEYNEKKAQEQSAWWAWYNEYLKSDKWQRKRRRVLLRDNEKCQACQDRKATEVHHLTYDRVGDEPLFDLVSICKTCHDFIHREKK